LIIKIILVYDDIGKFDQKSSGKVDSTAEFESPETIEALLAAMRAVGHDATGLPLGIDFPQRIYELRPDLVFNIAEGIRGSGRESLVPAWLDHLDIPYTGSDALTLAVSLDKALTKTLVAAHGVRTPAFRCIAHQQDLAELELQFPVFVKPNAQGTSMGIRRSSCVTTPAELEHQVTWVLANYDGDCLIEEYAPGREFCVAILGNTDPQILPVAEVNSEADFLSWEDKNSDHGYRVDLICPARIPVKLIEEMKNMALHVFRITNCRNLARVDFRMDQEGCPTFMEINPLPGLSPSDSMFPIQAEAAGWRYEELIGHIIELAVDRTRCREERCSVSTTGTTGTGNWIIELPRLSSSSSASS